MQGLQQREHSDTPVDHAAAKWVAMVLAVLDSPTDPKRLDGWGRLVGRSVTSLKDGCRAVGLSAKRSLDFARLLRAFLLSDPRGVAFSEFLDVDDPRTLTRLFTRFGCNPNAAAGVTACTFFTTGGLAIPRSCRDLLAEHLHVTPPTLHERQL